MNITKEIWEEISDLLKKHEIPYTTQYKSRDIQCSMEEADKLVQDKYIHIDLVIPNFFNE